MDSIRPFSLVDIVLEEPGIGISKFMLFGFGYLGPPFFGTDS